MNNPRLPHKVVLPYVSPTKTSELVRIISQRVRRDEYDSWYRYSVDSRGLNVPVELCLEFVDPKEAMIAKLSY